jgi:hypothetical protein
MRWFDFLESKFTKHSITQQVSFSAIADGEQKATQAYLWAVRLLCKWWALIKLPTEFLLCKLKVLTFPDPAPEVLERLMKESKAKSEQMKLDAMIQKKQQASGSDVGPENVTPIKPTLESRPTELQ